MDNKSYITQSVIESISKYLNNLEEQEPTNLYNSTLKQMETGLIRIVLERTQNNRSKAAEWLGISRGTLIKLIKKHNL